MRVFCLADTQDNPTRLEKYLEIVGPLLKRADVIIHLGDGILRARPFLEDYSNVICIRGNHDLTNDPTEHELNLHGQKFLFVHGEGNPWREQPNIWLNKIRHRLRKPPLLDSYYSRLYKKCVRRCDVLIYGHIHIPRLETYKNTTFFCPGGLPPKRLLFNTPPAVGEIIIKTQKNQLVHIFRAYALNLESKQFTLLWQKGKSSEK